MPRTLPLAPFLRLRLGRPGPALRLGPRGASVSLGPQGLRAEAGLPGTPLRWARRWPKGRRRRRIGVVGAGVLFVLTLAALGVAGR
jgi:hypothetical protein